MKKSRLEMRDLDDKIGINVIYLNQTQDIGNELSEVAIEVRMARQMVEEGIFDEVLYKDYVDRRKKDIKNLIAQIYGNMELDNVKCNFDKVFEKDSSSNE